MVVSNDLRNLKVDHLKLYNHDLADLILTLNSVVCATFLLFSSAFDPPTQHLGSLRRWNGALGQFNIINKSASWFNKTFPIIDAYTNVPKCERWWDDCLNLFTYSHVSYNFIKSRYNCCGAQLEQESILFSFSMCSIKNLEFQS